MFSDFRQIATPNEAGKSEKLFRAAVSAFCSITRPTRREASQLEDLALPLFDSVSADSLRYVAAALSECEFAPHALVRRLAEEPVDISAPLLVRSKVLRDVDLISLIGRHGIPHARAIARRQELNQTIDDLIRALFDSAARAAIESETPRLHQAPTLPMIAKVEEAVVQSVSEQTALTQPEAAPVIEIASSTEEIEEPPFGALESEDEVEAAPTPPARRTFGKADLVREQLRGMMRPSSPSEVTEVEDEIAPGLELPPRLNATELARLRDTALTGNPVFFQTALGDALRLDFAAARSITRASDYTDLSYALRSLEVADDTAFVIVAAAYPALFGHAESIRLFLDRYRLCHTEAARDRVRGWKAESVAATVRRARPIAWTAPAGDNTDAPDRGRATMLRAS